MVEHVVAAVGEHVHPAEPALGHGDLQAREARAHPRPEPVGGGDVGVHGEQRGEQLEGRVVAGQRHPRARNRCAGTRRSRSPRRRPASGSQWPVCSDGRPELGGHLGEAQRPEAPRSALPRTRSAATCGIVQPRDLGGDDPPGMGAGPHLVVPVVPRPHARQPELGVLRLRRTPTPQKPAMSDGKHTDASMPARSMSSMRASMSQHPRRISSKSAGSIDHSSRGSPDHRVEPDVRVERRPRSSRPAAVRRR